VHVYVWP
jgi:hypothetical protein